jgi:hypothetical protein
MNIKITFRAPSPFTFEVLYRAFVLFRRFPRVEGAEVFPLAGLRIYFARIEPVFTGLQFSNHCDLPPRNADLEGKHRVERAWLKISD